MNSFWDGVAGLTLVEWVQIASALGTALAAIAAMSAARAAKKSAAVAQKQLPEVQRQVEAANRTAAAAHAQNKLQQQLRIDAMQPQVWVDLRPQEEQPAMLVLIVGNSGPSVARNVKVTVEPTLVAVDSLRERLELGLRRLAAGLPSLAPGRVLTWPVGQTFNVITGADEQKFKFALTADGPYGPIDPIEYVIDLADWRGSMT